MLCSKIRNDPAMRDVRIIAGIPRKFQLLAPEMDERPRRQWSTVGGRTDAAAPSGIATNRGQLAQGCGLQPTGQPQYSRRSVPSGRNAQFEHINLHVRTFHHRRQPAISVGTTKKELVGEFANGGREWRPMGSPELVRVHGLIDPILGKAIPNGVHDMASNKGWVSMGITHDITRFAVASIRCWW